MQVSLKARWTLASEGALAMRQWDDEFVVHHALSNDTHRLSGAAGCILRLLAAAGPLETPQLVIDSGLATSEAEAALAALAGLGFVARC